MRSRAVAPALVLLLAACAGPKLETADCRPADGQLVQRTATRLVDVGRLRNGFVVDSAGRRFLSAELLEPGDDLDSDGPILTWQVDPTGSLLSVDERARKKTSWPKSEDIDVREDGATSSRACVLDTFRES